jgi:hypothetical protein
MAKASRVNGAAGKWAKRIERYEKSGLSQRAFAIREGLNAGTLSFWRWKLRGGGREQKEGRIAPLRFVELTAKATTPRVSMGMLEIVLRSGQTVRVPGGFDSGELSRVVQMLEEERL